MSTHSRSLAPTHTHPHSLPLSLTHPHPHSLPLLHSSTLTLSPSLTHPPTLRDGRRAPRGQPRDGADGPCRQPGRLLQVYKPETLHFRPETRNPKPETRKIPPVVDLGTGRMVLAVSLGVSYRFPEPEVLNPKPETRNPQFETRNPKPEARDPQLDT